MSVDREQVRREAEYEVNRVHPGAIDQRFARYCLILLFDLKQAEQRARSLENAMRERLEMEKRLAGAGMGVPDWRSLVQCAADVLRKWEQAQGEKP